MFELQVGCNWQFHGLDSCFRNTIMGMLSKCLGSIWHFSPLKRKSPSVEEGKVTGASEYSICCVLCTSMVGTAWSYEDIRRGSIVSAHFMMSVNESVS